ncbi:MAG: hypothetical protein HY878_03035, partial [Deltaproteobacteria bacterium]|nr:hypothetical protein [Deltaproteobacteria bacterium]
MTIKLDMHIRNGIGFVLSPLLESIPSITHALLTRIGGRSKGVFSTLNLDPGDGDEEANINYHRTLIGGSFGFDPLRLVT